jgi:hypothetical protein
MRHIDLLNNCLTPKLSGDRTSSAVVKYWGNIMDLVSLGLGLLSGGGGGLLGGKLTNSSMGKGAQMLTGIVGGTGLAALAPMIPGLEGVFASPADGAALNVSSILGGVVSGGIGGTILSFILAKVMGNKG